MPRGRYAVDAAVVLWVLLVGGNWFADLVRRYSGHNSAAERCVEQRDHFCVAVRVVTHYELYFGAADEEPREN